MKTKFAVGSILGMLAFAAGLTVGGAVVPDFAETLRSESREMVHCRAVLRNDPEILAMLRVSGLTRVIEESDAASLVCGCATNSVAPTATLRWGYMKNLRRQRLPYCIGTWQARLDDRGADTIVRVERKRR